MFFGAFLFILSILSISIEQTPAHNQEITIHFSNNQQSEDNIEKAIASLKRQLSALDITHFKVQQLDNAFKITYHSNIAVSQIKEVLSLNTNNEQALESNVPSTPEPLGDYEIAITTIQHQNTGFDGVSGTVVEYKYETTRSTDVKIYGSITANTFANDNPIITSQKVTTIYTGITLETTSYNIPLVRAGPLS